MKTLRNALIWAITLFAACETSAGPLLLSEVIAEYGIKEVANYLKERGDGRLYAKTSNGLRLAVRPSSRLVDESTLRRDLFRLKLDVQTLRAELAAQRAENARTAAELELERERYENAHLRSYIESAPSPTAGQAPARSHSPDMVERARRFTNQRREWARQDNVRRSYTPPGSPASSHLTYGQRQALRNARVGAPTYRRDLSAEENAARQNAHNARARTIIGEAGLNPDKYVKDQVVLPSPPPPTVIITR